MNSTRPTFAEKAKKKIQPLITFNHPTEEQGIIFNHVEGVKIREYLLAIYQQVGGPKNIVAASRVSGGRVIIFLASKEIVEDFQIKYGGFKFQNDFIKTRKLKTPSAKLIISNVSPTVPNAAIEDLLKNTLKLKLASPISILRVNPQDDLFSHVVSWRRQVYVHPTEDLSQLPNSVQLSYADRTYRIFTTLDDLTCFKCSSRGHKAEECPEIVDDEFEDVYAPKQPEMSNEINQRENFPEITQKTTPHSLQPDDQPTIPVTVQPKTKRGPSTIESTAPSLNEGNWAENLNPDAENYNPRVNHQINARKQIMSKQRSHSS